ncbi:MAG TPA: ribonuclease P protein component [Methylomirabilota bacterium]|jgi:ribonuclease P protein component|nr:ribonuclease P protein component [Methylomirabilota bacterium]
MVAGAVERATLPRGERLRDRGELQGLFQGGARLERAGFVLLWRWLPGRRAAAFAASRRLGGSTARNRARRRLREAYRQQKALLPSTGLRLCFVARPAALRMPFPELSREIAHALRQAAPRPQS